MASVEKNNLILIHAMSMSEVLGDYPPDTAGAGLFPGVYPWELVSSGSQHFSDNHVYPTDGYDTDELVHNKSDQDMDVSQSRTPSVEPEPTKSGKKKRHQPGEPGESGGSGRNPKRHEAEQVVSLRRPEHRDLVAKGKEALLVSDVFVHNIVT